MIKLIILDYDGVIRHLDVENAKNKCKNKGFIFEDLMMKIWNHPISLELITGKIDRKKWWHVIQQHNDDLINIDQNFIWDVIFEKSIINMEVIDVIRQLKQNYLTVILTNCDKDSKKLIINEMENIDGLNLFDHIFSSAEFGFAKPSHDIFIKVLNTLNINPQECIFIDDTQKNVIGAREIGIHSFKFENATQIMNKLKEINQLYK